MRPIAQLPPRTPTAAAVVLAGRRARLSPALAAASCGSRAAVVLRSGGRRRGAREQLVSELLNSDVTTVVVSSILSLHPIPAHALEALAVLRAAGLRVFSMADAWVSSADPATIQAVANFLRSAEARKNSKRGHDVIAEIRRKQNAKVGRPRKPVDVERARVLVEQHGYRKAASMLGNISASSVRRALLHAAPIIGGAP